MASEWEKSVIDIGWIPDFVSQGVRRGSISETEAQTILAHAERQGGLRCIWIKTFERILGAYYTNWPGDVREVFSTQLELITEAEKYLTDFGIKPKTK